MIAIVVGHGGIKNDPGCQNRELGVTEYDFNKKLAYDIQAKLTLPSEVVFRDTYRGLPAKINAMNPSFVLELHCNAHDQRASGSEMIYYHMEKDSKRLAEILLTEVVDVLGLNNRGVKTVGDKTPDINWDERGEWLLDEVNPPSVVTEPFFLDNDADYQTVMDNYDEFVMAHVRAISQFHFAKANGFV